MKKLLVILLALAMVGLVTMPVMAGSMTDAELSAVVAGNGDDKGGKLEIENVNIDNDFIDYDDNDLIDMDVAIDADVQAASADGKGDDVVINGNVVKRSRQVVRGLHVSTGVNTAISNANNSNIQANTNIGLALNSNNTTGSYNGSGNLALGSFNKTVIIGKKGHK